MFRSQFTQVVGFMLLGLAVVGFVLTQVFQCSVSTELVPYDPRDFFDPSDHPLLDVIYNDRPVIEADKLLSENPDWVTQPIYQEWYAVHCAAQAARTDILQLLIDRGADIHVLSAAHGSNVIVSAFESDDPETLAFVLDAGVDPHIKFPDGTPLEYIRKYGSPELNRVLDERGLPEQSP